MPETQIRRPDGSNTTIPELLQELAAKEAAGAGPRAKDSAGDQGRFVAAAPDQGTREHAARRPR